MLLAGCFDPLPEVEALDFRGSELVAVFAFAADCFDFSDSTTVFGCAVVVLLATGALLAPVLVVLEPAPLAGVTDLFIAVLVSFCNLDSAAGSYRLTGLTVLPLRVTTAAGLPAAGSRSGGGP